MDFTHKRFDFLLVIEFVFHSVDGFYLGGGGAHAVVDCRAAHGTVPFTAKLAFGVAPGSRAKFPRQRNAFDSIAMRAGFYSYVLTIYLLVAMAIWW